MNYFKILILSCFSFSFSSIVFAQKDKKPKEERNVNFDYGRIPKADLDMKFYAPDSSAEAVVLTMKGRTSIEIHSDGKPEVTRRTLVRIKFFKKSAFEQYGKVKITYNSHNNNINLHYVKAAVIQADGTRQELTKKDFIDEKTSSVKKSKKFTFPNLSEGCIVEYEFLKTYTHFGKLPDWLFQDNIPVRHSELWLNLPIIFDYVSVSKGTQEIIAKAYDKSSSSRFESQEIKLYADTVPALKAEQYITTMDDYLSQADFYLKKINYPDGETEDILSTWDKLAKEFITDKNLGEQYLNKENYDEVWKAIKPNLTDAKTDSAKTQIIYDYLCQNMNLADDGYSIYSPESLNESFIKKTAYSGELNLMMIACLKEAGIKSYPMLVSTRSNGKPVTIYPVGDQFNHLVCYIARGEKSIIADVGSTFRPIGMPRIESLNNDGWILEERNPHWLHITPPTSSKVMTANFKLNSEGTLKGSISGSFRGYAAMKERDDEVEKHDKTKKDLAIAYPDIKFDSISSLNFKNIAESYKRSVYCEIPNIATSANDLMYVKPTLKTDFDENPFKQPKRQYAIEFPYPLHDQYILNLTIPDGYMVEEKPKSVEYSLLNKGGSFKYSMAVNQNIVQLSVKIEINQLAYLPEDYGDVKDFFNQVANKLAEQIVLKKK